MQSVTPTLIQPGSAQLPAPLSSAICPVCEGEAIMPVIEIPAIPVHCCILHATRREALAAPMGRVSLALCRGCGHVFNRAFDPARMAYAEGNYENSLHFSPHFQRYAEAVATALIERYGIRGKQVLEIGCGKGEFLSLLCALGNNTGLGFDPSYVPGRGDAAADGRVTVIRDLYSEAYAHHAADLICCRHVLEHIRRPGDLLGCVRRAIGGRRDTVVFFEVPNLALIFEDLSLWDIIYEHCSYFSAESLAEAFRRNGFEVCAVGEAFDGQYLCIEARPAPQVGRAAQTVPLSPVAIQHDGSSQARPDGPVHLAHRARALATAYHPQIEAWTARLDRWSKAGRRVVIWGTGAKGVSFLNAVETRDKIRYAVDINPHKNGKYVPGSGQEIITPERLPGLDDPPDLIIVMNPVYQSEIETRLRALGLGAEIVTML